MTFLADTHALVWAVNTPELLGGAARAAFEERQLIVSVASLWELCLKARKPGAPVANPLKWWSRYITRVGVPTLPIRTSDVITLDSLPEVHKYPFDRILVAQAVSEGIPLVTKDSNLARYGVATIW